MKKKWVDLFCTKGQSGNLLLPKNFEEINSMEEIVAAVGCIFHNLFPWH